MIYALFGRRAHRVARAFLILAILFVIVEQVYMWTLMLIVVISIGTDHPPTSDDSMPIGPLRWLLGLASLAIPVFCFTPFAIKL